MITPRQTLGFFVLCLLSSLSWLTSGLLPSSLKALAGEGVRLVLVGLVGLLAYLLSRRCDGLPAVASLSLVGGASLGLIGVPSFLLAGAEGRVASTCGVLVFAGMPILLAVVGASSSAGGVLRGLPSGLMGVAGLLILLPLQLPRGGTGVLGLGFLLLAMVLVAICMIWLHLLLDGVPTLLATALAGLVNGVVLLLAGGADLLHGWDWRRVGMEGLRCLLIDLPETVLLIWLVKEITPQRLSVRYAVAPLLTVIEGLLVMRPRFEVRTLFGLVVLGLGAYLMLRSERVEEVSLRLR